MNNRTTSTRKETQAMAYADDDKAIKTVIVMLSPAVAAETASFTVDSSLQLYPEAMRGRPDTPPATSLREYHFSVLMAQVARAYAEGRGQDFADGRSAVDSLLREEPQHQPLAERFRQLMGLWLQEAHDKRQREELERQQLEDEDDEMEDSEDSEQGEGEEAGEESKAGNASVASQESPSSSSSTASADGQRDSKDVDEVDGSPAAARTRSVFDLSGLITTDDSSDDDDDDSSSDEEGITRK